MAIFFHLHVCLSVEILYQIYFDALLQNSFTTMDNIDYLLGLVYSTVYEKDDIQGLEVLGGC